jgi:hypothetical protein
MVSIMGFHAQTGENFRINFTQLESLPEINFWVNTVSFLPTDGQKEEVT